MTNTNPDGSLKIVEWARQTERGHLFTSSLSRPVKMPGSRATGLGLVSNGKLGADIIRLKAGDGFAPHTHSGDHLLIVIYGEGTITYAGKVYPTYAGQIYMVEGAIPHAVGAITDHVIMAVGSPHKTVDDPERMALVDYAAVAAEFGELHCLICDKTATLPDCLHDVDCPHCPCGKK